MKKHEKFMKKCLDLAKLGLKKTKSNPLVGCIITHQDKIISEGYHKKYGDFHAETNAINNVKNKDLLPLSTLYVNLEPCAHYGKTPPCINLIIKYNIKQVIIGTLDPFKKVNGQGIKQLKKHTNVIIGVLEKECIEINKQYFINHTLRRPFLILKWAESKDGFINNNQKGITQISSEESLLLSHKWRSQIDGIMVGTNTVICDNPTLTNRKTKGPNPIRITIDRKNRLTNEDLNILNMDAETLVFNRKHNKKFRNIRYIKIDQKGTNQNELFDIIKELYLRGLNSILIEGGKILLENFISQNLWDEIRVFSSKKEIKNGIKSPSNLDKVKTKKIHKKLNIGPDNLAIIKNQETSRKIRTIILSKSL